MCPGAGAFDLGGEGDDRGFAARGTGELDGGREAIFVEPGGDRGGGLAEVVPGRGVGDVRGAADQCAERAGEPCHLATGLVGGSFPPVREVNLPASDPLVLAAGGTTLIANHTTGRYISETGWGLPYGSPGTQFQASGGGFSRLFARPSYQAGLPASGPDRGVPDVAADAAAHTGMAIITSNGSRGYAIRNSGGTSATAPLWAGVIALADQYAHRDLGFVNPAIYQIG